jgi:hypothetical protein
MGALLAWGGFTQPSWVARDQNTMIRSKQMDELRKLDRDLRAIGAPKTPSLEQHVMIALTSGELPKLKPAAKISESARRKIISSGYSSNRNFSFGEVFASCNGYEDEMKQFNAYEKTRQAVLARYGKESEKIMLRAMNKDADAELISEELHEAAERAGLKTLVAPVFGTIPTDED